MAIYIDDMELDKQKWCHMTADTQDELHNFASLIDLKRAWYQGKAHHKHYDVTGSKKAHAVSVGRAKGYDVQCVTTEEYIGIVKVLREGWYKNAD